MTVKPIPEGFHSVTPVLAVDGGVEALAFYERAFGAEVLRQAWCWAASSCTPSCASATRSSACPTRSPSTARSRPKADQPVPVALMIYTEDVDALYARAVEAGATAVNEPNDTFHGDRAGSLRDPYGHRWMLCTHIEDMSEEEMQRRTEEAMA